jgi:pimeloyl-ACP methyl ester carboxylesterase
VNVTRVPALASFTLGSGSHATLLLHGFLGSGKNLRTVAQRWLERDPGRCFLLPDLLGHGESPPLPPDATTDTVARAVLACASEAGLAGPLSLVGHSLGGRVALAAARIEPALVRDIVLLDIAPGSMDPAQNGSRQVLDVLLAAPDAAADRREMRGFFTGQGLSPALADWLLMNLRAEGGQVTWRVDRRGLAVLHDVFHRDDLWPVIEARAVPMSCIRGGASRYVNDADAGRMDAAGCPVTTLGEAGHYLHVDALDALIDALCPRAATSLISDGRVR